MYNIKGNIRPSGAIPGVANTIEFRHSISIKKKKPTIKGERRYFESLLAIVSEAIQIGWTHFRFLHLK